MSDYCTKLPVPHALHHYNATICVTSEAGDIKVTSNCGVGEYINVAKELPCRPRVTVQAKDLAGKDNGPCFCYDYDADQGRGVWVIYAPDLHLVPQVSAALPDPDLEKKESVFISAFSEVELEASAADAPDADLAPHKEDDEDDEPIDDLVD